MIFEETWREDGKVGELQFAHQFPKLFAIGLLMYRLAFYLYLFGYAGGW